MTRTPHSIQRTVKEFIERHSMIDGASGIVVAVSGGPDSVAMLDILLRTAAGINLHVAHLNHLLRGAESGQDAEFVRELAQRLGLAATISSSDVREIARTTGRGIEEIARELRYKFLARVADETGCNRIAVGHTMSDQAETVLMRLIRGAGLRGLAAMRPIVPAHSFDSPRAKDRTPASSAATLRSPFYLIRPLLSITREEVEDYCHQRGLEFRTDTTNVSLDYTRNRIRSEVIPALAAINPRAVESIARAADNLAGAEEALTALASSLLSQARTEEADGDFEPGASRYPASSLLEQPAGLRRRMILDAIKRARREGSTEEVTSKHVADVESLLKPLTSGKHICLPDGVEVWREFEALVFRTKRSKSAYRVSVVAGQGLAEAGGFAFAIQRNIPGACFNSVVAEAQEVRQRTGRDWMIVALDDDALPADLIIRPRLKGERVDVVSKLKTKKLKTLMIDHRIPASRRADWPVVTSSEGDYVWSPGLPPSAKFAARRDTPRLAILRASIIGFRAEGFSEQPQWDQT
jgi:tRNA(Ile)-lysidine synthase